MFLRIFEKWLPLAILTAGLCGLVYLTVQQSLRNYANDPQIQLAEDGASALEAGAAPETLIPAQKVDLAASLAPFIMVLDTTGSVTGSSAVLNGENPSLPVGVLDYARQHGENRVTWQPESGVRIAAVIKSYNGGFVLAGRSLREIELREDQTFSFSMSATLVLWVATLAAIGLGEFFRHAKEA